MGHAATTARRSIWARNRPSKAVIFVFHEGATAEAQERRDAILVMLRWRYACDPFFCLSNKLRLRIAADGGCSIVCRDGCVPAGASGWQSVSQAGQPAQPSSATQTSQPSSSQVAASQPFHAASPALSLIHI